MSHNEFQPLQRKPILEFFVGFAIFIVIVIAAIYGIIFILQHIGPEGQLGQQAPFLITAAFATIAWFAKSTYERGREHKRLVAETKRQHYFEFLEFFADAMNRVDANDSKANETDVRIALIKMRKWNLRMALVASDSVIKEWNVLRQDLASMQKREGQVDLMATLKPWGKLIISMRKDLGYRSRSLNENDMLQLFINDTDGSLGLQS